MANNNNYLSELHSDNRFFIDDFTVKRIFDSISLIEYDFCSYPIGRIYMEMKKSLLRLSETIVYKFLSGSTTEKYALYDDYCKKYGSKNPNRNVESFE